MVNNIHHFTGRTPCPAAEVSNNMPSGCMNFIRTKYYSLITEWPCWAQALRPEGSGGNLARFFDSLLECHREQTTYTDAYSDAVTTKRYKTTTKRYKTTRKAAAFHTVFQSESLSIMFGGTYVSEPRGPLSYNLSMMTTVIDFFFLLSSLYALINEMSCCIDWLAWKPLYTWVLLPDSRSRVCQVKTSGDKWPYFLFHRSDIIQYVFIRLQ